MIRKFVNFIRNRLSKPATPVTPSDAATVAAESDATAAGKKRRRSRKPKKSGENLAVETTVASAAAPWNPESFQVTPEEGKSRFHDFDL
ncbi:MAG TPA: hypothetical protein VLA15_09910, partial [Desulfurivibrionaceae bacterium]|nr:hypothetical protein [Desulfurivibrionaceae bacterium]